MVRKIGLYGNYFEDFYIGQTQKVKDKIDYVLDMIKHVNQVPIKSKNILKVQKACMKSKLKRPLKTSGFFAFLTKEILSF